VKQQRLRIFWVYICLEQTDVPKKSSMAVEGNPYGHTRTNEEDSPFFSRARQIRAYPVISGVELVFAAYIAV